MRTAVIFLLFAIPLRAAELSPPAGYEVRSLKGFTLLVHRDVLAQPSDRFGRRPLDILETEFDDLKRVIRSQVLSLLQSVPVWVQWDVRDPAMQTAVAIYYGGAAEKLARHGMEPLKANCIEILSLKRIGELRLPGSKFQQIVTLHEMAHAVQHRLLGMDATEVKAAFDQAVERRLYDQVSDRFGRTARAYGRNNAAEYFAELSCAYLDSCHFYPFTYSDLKIHDPAGFALMESVWKRPEQFASRQIVVKTPRFSSNQAAGVIAANAPTKDPAVERDAYLKLDQATSQLRDGHKEEARKALAALIQKYPATLAATDGQQLLATLH